MYSRFWYSRWTGFEVALPPLQWICAGDNISYRYTIGSGWGSIHLISWSPQATITGDASGQSWQVAPDATTTYSLLVVHASITASATHRNRRFHYSTFCTGYPHAGHLWHCAQTCVTEDPQFTYQMSLEATLSNTTVSNPEACPETTTTYTVTVTDASGFRMNTAEATLSYSPSLYRSVYFCKYPTPSHPTQMDSTTAGR
ncbi:MAG: hypothetical protein R2795_23155 [Saprospiraceae bacterium]